MSTLTPTLITSSVCSWFLLAAFISASDIRAQTQAEMNKDACGKFAQADAELNSVYQRVLTEYAAETRFTDKLEAAQRAWITFRDAHLEALYPQADKQQEYGSVYPMCRCFALTEITKRRVDELKPWLNGLLEGESCRGSVKTIPGPNPPK